MTNFHQNTREEQRVELEPPAGSRYGAVFGILTLAVLAVGLPVLVGALGGGERLRALVEETGAWTPVAYVAAKAGTSVVAPLAGTPLKAVAGALFGLRDGIIYSVVGDVTGGCISFWIARSLGRGAAAWLVGTGGIARVDELARGLGGWRALLFARLILSSIYNLVSFAAGLTKLPFRQYLAVTVLGGIVHTSLLVALGASATLGREVLPVAYGGIAVVFVLALLTRRRLRHALRRMLGGTVLDEEPSQQHVDRRGPEAKRGRRVRRKLFGRR